MRQSLHHRSVEMAVVTASPTIPLTNTTNSGSSFVPQVAAEPQQARTSLPDPSQTPCNCFMHRHQHQLCIFRLSQHLNQRRRWELTRFICIVVLSTMATLSSIVGLLTSFWYVGPGNMHYGIAWATRCLEPRAPMAICPFSFNNLRTSTEFAIAWLLITAGGIGLLCVIFHVRMFTSALHSRLATLCNLVQSSLLAIAIMVYVSYGCGLTAWKLPPGATIGWSLIVVVVGSLFATIAAALTNDLTWKQANYRLSMCFLTDQETKPAVISE